MMLGVQQTELGQECFTGRKFYHPYPKGGNSKQTDSFPFCLSTAVKGSLCMEMFAGGVSREKSCGLLFSKETVIRCPHKALAS